MKKRLSIFSFYNKQGIVDEYVLYILKELKKSIDRVIIICNGELSSEGRQLLEGICKEVIVRENSGFDIWGYKYGIDYLGWDEIEKYDSLTLLNDTVYGPLVPFDYIYNKMENKKIDFWGITKGFGGNIGTCEPYKNTKIPQHIQSYFTCFNQKILCSYEFRQYWSNLPKMNSKGDAVYKHEIYLTDRMSKYGFKWDVFVDHDGLEEISPDPLLFYTEDMVKNRKCPFIKKRIFYSEYIGGYYTQIYQTTGQNLINTFNYIKDYTSYDTSLIIKNLLKNQNLSDIKTSLHLNYILPSQQVLKKVDINKKVALFSHIYYKDSVDYILEYAESMPTNADIIICTPKTEVKEYIQYRCSSTVRNNIKVVMGENKGRDVAALLVTLKPYVNDYDYICFVHGKKTKTAPPLTIGESFLYKCINNLLVSKEYVTNIIGLFDEDDHLGILCPPPPYHGIYISSVGNEWTNNYDNTKKLTKKLGVNVDISPSKEPIAPLGSMFWFRSDALKTIFDYDWKYDDFPKEPLAPDGTISHAIERSYGFIAQHNGYYSGYVMNDKFANIEFTNIRLLLRESKNNTYSSEMELGVIGLMKEHFKSRVNSQKFLYKFMKIVYKFIRRVYRTITRKPRYV